MQSWGLLYLQLTLTASNAVRQILLTQSREIFIVKSPKTLKGTAVLFPLLLSDCLSLPGFSKLLYTTTGTLPVQSPPVFQRPAHWLIPPINQCSLLYQDSLFFPRGQVASWHFVFWVLIWLFEYMDTFTVTSKLLK